MTYAVSGSTGAFGNLVVHALIAEGIKPASIVALARDEAKAAALKALGVQIRIASYDDFASLKIALKGVDRLLLVSSSEVGHRAIQHINVINAAKDAGISLVAYTSITRANTSTNPLAPDHKATEEALKSSGLNWVILRHNWYTENYLPDLSRAKDNGVLAAAVASGKVASASRKDYAAAAAKILTGTGLEGKIFEFGGSKAWDYNELAASFGRVLGRPVTYKALSVAELSEGLKAAGLPEGTIAFVASLDTAIAEGTLDLPSDDLKKVLGRELLSLDEVFKSHLGG